MVCAMVAASGFGCARQAAYRTQWEGRPRGRTSFLVFEAPNVRDSLHTGSVAADVLRWEYARNDDSLGIQPSGAKPQNDRFYGQSDWYRAPRSHSGRRQRPDRDRKDGRSAHSVNY